MTHQLAEARARQRAAQVTPPTREEALSPVTPQLVGEGDTPRGGTRVSDLPRGTPGKRPPPDEWGPVLGATVGAASVAIVVGCGYWLVRWLAGQPPVFWGRVAAVAAVVLGFGAMVGGCVRVGRANHSRRKAGA